MTFHPDGGGGGSKVTPYNLSAVPLNQAVSDYGNGQTIVGGLPNGLVSRDVGGRFTSIVDDGVTARFEVAAGGTGLTVGDAALNDSIIHSPSPLMGDCEVTVKMGAEDVANPWRDFGPVLFWGNASSKTGWTGAVMLTYGNNKGVFGGRASFAGGFSSGTFSSAIQSVSPFWMKLLVQGGVLKCFNGGTGASPSWVQQGSDLQMSANGSVFYAGVLMYAKTATQYFNIESLEINGYEYTNDP